MKYYQDFLNSLDKKKIQGYCKKCIERIDCPFMVEHPITRFKECETLQEVF